MHMHMHKKDALACTGTANLLSNRLYKGRHSEKNSKPGFTNLNGCH